MIQNQNCHYYRVLQNNVIKRTVLAIFGWVLGIIGSVAIFLFVYLFYQFNENGKIIMLAACISLLALFLISLINYSTITRRTNRFRIYIVLISGERKTKLNELAHMTSRSILFVKKDLKKMIKQYYFLFAMINNETNELIVYMPPQQQESADEKTNLKEKKPNRMYPLAIFLCSFSITIGLILAGVILVPILSEYLNLNWGYPSVENLLDIQSDNTQDLQNEPATTDLPEAIPDLPEAIPDLPLYVGPPELTYHGVENITRTLAYLNFDLDRTADLFIAIYDSETKPELPMTPTDVVIAAGAIRQTFFPKYNPMHFPSPIHLPLSYLTADISYVGYMVAVNPGDTSGQNMSNVLTFEIDTSDME